MTCRSKVTWPILKSIRYEGFVPALPMEVTDFFRIPGLKLRDLGHVLLRPEFFSREEMMAFCAEALEAAERHLNSSQTTRDVIVEVCHALREGETNDELIDDLKALQDLEVLEMWRLGTSHYSPAWHWMEAAVKASMHPFSPYSARNCFRTLVEFFNWDADAQAAMKEVLRCRVEGGTGLPSRGSSSPGSKSLASSMPRS